jgi:hypothetical protein
MQEIFNRLLDMSDDERKAFVKNMSESDRSGVIEMMGLHKKCSQKQLCHEIAETARFIRIAKGGQ